MVTPTPFHGIGARAALPEGTCCGCSADLQFGKPLTPSERGTRAMPNSSIIRDGRENSGVIMDFLELSC